MSRKLNTYVYVGDQWYGPHSVVPAEVAEKIRNPKVWVSDPEPKEPTVVKEPPRKGPGSGGPAWIEFAASKGVTRQFDSKEALIAHLEENNLIDKG